MPPARRPASPASFPDRSPESGWPAWSRPPQTRWIRPPSRQFARCYFPGWSHPAPPPNFGPEPEQRQRNHGDRNGRADRNPDLEHEVKRGGAENDAEHRPQDKGARRAFRHARLRRDVRMKGGAAPAGCRRMFIRCHGACNKPSPRNGEQNLCVGSPRKGVANPPGMRRIPYALGCFLP